MPSTQPGRRPAQPPVPSRRSHRQERIAKRHPERDLMRASTAGKRRGLSPIMLVTGLAIVIAVAIIGFAIFRNPATNPGALSAIHTPPYVTATSLPQNGLTLGDGPVKVTIYADFQCTGCGSWIRANDENLVKDFVATHKITLTHHDTIVIDPSSTGESHDAANAARCAADQGKFWQYHDWLYFNQQGENVGSFTQDRLIEAGRQLGSLDMTKFQTCVNNHTHATEVTASSADWNNSWGNPTTPTFTVDGTHLTDISYAGVTSAIDAAYAKATSSGSPAPSASPTPSPSAS